MSVNKGHWFWESARAADQYRHAHGSLPWPSANCSLGGDPVIVGWQPHSNDGHEWLDGPVLVAVDFDQSEECWRQVVCLTRADRDLIWGDLTYRLGAEDRRVLLSAVPKPPINWSPLTRSEESRFFEDSRRDCCTWVPEFRGEGRWRWCPTHVAGHAALGAALPTIKDALDTRGRDVVGAALAVAGVGCLTNLPTDPDRVQRFLDALDLL